MKNLSIRTKFMITLIMLFLVLFGVLASTLIRQQAVTTKESLNEKSQAFAELATAPIGDTYLNFKDSGTVRITQQTKRFYELDSDLEGLAIINTSGKIVYTYGKEKRKYIDISKLEGFDSVYSYNDDKVITQIINPYVENSGQYRYALVYKISPTRVERDIRLLTQTILILGSLFTILGVIVFYTLFNIIFIRPVREVSRLAGVISLGNFDQEITVASNDEINDLATSVNAMADKLKADIIALQESDRMKNEFIMISSHNLRTPLTVINGYLEMMKLVDIDQKLQEFLKIIEKNIEKLTKLTEDMITISTIESGGALTHGDPVEINPILVTIAKNYTAIAELKEVRFITSLKLTNERCAVNKAHFQSAITNFVDNAIKFTAEKGTVHFSALVEDQVCIITVSDTGSGIDDTELPHLFTKFHRGTDTMHYDYEGVGIGLYVSKIIIDQLGGKITVTSKKGEGTTFHIAIPLVKTAEAPA